MPEEQNQDQSLLYSNTDEGIEPLAGWNLGKQNSSRDRANELTSWVTCHLAVKKCLWSLSFIYETCGPEVVQHLALLSAASIDHSLGSLRKDLLALGLMSVSHILKGPSFGTKRGGVRSRIWSPTLRPRDSFNSTLSKGKNE